MFKLCDAIKIGIENGSNRVSWIFKRAWSVRTQLKKKKEKRLTKRFFFTGCYSNNVLSRPWSPHLSVGWLMRGSNAAASSSQAVDWQVRVAQRSPNVNYNLQIALNRPWWAKQRVCLGSPWLSQPDDLTGESASCLSFGEPNWWSGRCTGTQTRVHSEVSEREKISTKPRCVLWLHLPSNCCDRDTRVREKKKNRQQDISICVEEIYCIVRLKRGWERWV